MQCIGKIGILRPVELFVICTLRLCAQGFPLHPSVWPLSGKLCSFHSLLPESRHPRKVCQQAGNSMNLAVLQVAQLHGYLSLVPRVIPALLQLIPKMRHEERRQKKRRRIRGKTPAREAPWAPWQGSGRDEGD